MLPNQTPSTRNRLHLTLVKGVLEAHLLLQTPPAIGSAIAIVQVTPQTTAKDTTYLHHRT